MLYKLEAFKDKKVTNVLKSIENSKTPDLNKFIYALGIDNVGIKTAKQLASHFKTFANLKNATVDQLVELNDISYITANGIVEYFKDQNNILELEKLEIAGVKPKEHKLAKSISDSIFSGKKVVLTGTLQTLSRPKATEILEKLGAEVVSSVSKNTDFVIVGQDAGSKLQKAISLNVKTLNEQDFLNYVNKN